MADEADIVFSGGLCRPILFILFFGDWTMQITIQKKVYRDEAIVTSIRVFFSRGTCFRYFGIEMHLKIGQ